MAGPDNQQTKQLVIPFGESPAVYRPTELAQKIVNFEVTTKATLASIRGPTVYEPKRGATDPSSVFGEMHGIFHTTLMGGTSDMLIVRSGTKMYRHTGWQRGWEQIRDGLTSDTRPNYPDQFLVLNDKIVWTNGIDYPLVINGHGSVFQLGFSQQPSAPSVYGPQKVSGQTSYPNSGGYSWRGDIGTPGDVLSGTQGSVLDGSWLYYIQHEDIYGNLSASSPPSNPLIVRTIQAQPFDPKGTDDQATGATIDDLTRQAVIRITAKGSDQVVATNLYRTPDTVRASTKPRFLARFAGRETFIFGDRNADSDLGTEMEETISMPVFRTMCAHQGCLIIANTPQDPGIVRRSSPGFPGTLPKDDYVYPDTGGAEVTAVASHAGFLLAFTERAVYDITEFEKPIPLAQGVGCVAPRSVQALPDGRLIWLARDGFYVMDTRGAITLASVPIQETVRFGLNLSRLRKAVAAIDATTLEYRCALAPAGESRNTLAFTFDGQNWREMRLGMQIADICRTNDYRQYLLFAGQYATIEEGEAGPVTVAKNNVFVMDRETTAFEPPARTSQFRSGWIYADATGMTPIHVRSLYLGMLDTNDATFTVRFYRNGSWKPVIEMTDVLAVGVDDGTDVVAETAGLAVAGDSSTHAPRLFWRMVPVGLENAYSWAFEIETAYPTRVDLASFAFDQSPAGSGNLRGRVPLRADR